MQDKDNKHGIIKACVITVGIVLVLSVAFIFLAFRTDYIFNIDADSAITSASFERTSVSTVIEEIHELGSGGGSSIRDEDDILLPDINTEDSEYDADPGKYEGGWWYPPKAGESIEVSFGVDAYNENRTVTSQDTWTIEYSIQGCYSAFGQGALCSRRLTTAYNLFGVNHNDSGDLLKLVVDGTPCFAGAMIQGQYNPGDLVQVQLVDGQQFYFLILDVKSNQHTYEELGYGAQVQNAWGHGYPEGSTGVQMSICEFICNQTRDGKSNAKFLPSGGFLNGNKVLRARTVKHVDIDGTGKVTNVMPSSSMPGIPPEAETQ